MSDAQTALNSIASQVDAIAAARRAKATGSRAAAMEEDAAASLLDRMAADIRAARIRDPKVLRDLRYLQFARPRNIRWQYEESRPEQLPLRLRGEAGQ